MANQNNARITQPGLLMTEDMKKGISAFISYNGYSIQEANDAAESMARFQPSMLDFFARRIMAQRESAAAIIQDLVKQGVLRAKEMPASNGGSSAMQPASQQQERKTTTTQSGMSPITSPAPAGGRPTNKPGSGTKRDSSKGRLYLIKDDPFGRACDQFRIYGSKTALQISTIYNQNVEDSIDCIMLAFAEVDPSKGKKNGKSQFGWDKSVQFAMTDVEAVCLVNVILGRQPMLLNPLPQKKGGQYEYGEGIYHKSPNGAYKNLKGGYFPNGNQYVPPNGVQLTMISNQNTNGGKAGALRVNIAIPDRIRLASFILSRLKMSPIYKGLTPSEILSISRDVM